MEFFSSCKREQGIIQTFCPQDEEYETNLFTGILGTDELSLHYQHIWKELFLKETGFSEEDFDRHVDMYATEFRDWHDRTDFVISYTIKVDWVVNYRKDYFTVKYKNDNSYREKEDIWVPKTGYSYHCINLSKLRELKFKTFENAMEHLKSEMNVSNLCYKYICINSPKFKDDEFLLYASATCKSTCRIYYGYLNLNTGETDIYEENCVD